MWFIWYMNQYKNLGIRGKIAFAVAFLAPDRASAITGKLVVGDGGVEPAVQYQEENTKSTDRPGGSNSREPVCQ